MSSNALTPSTSRLDFSSGGASPIASTKQWDHTLCLSFESGEARTGRPSRQVFLPLYQGTGGGPFLVFGVHLIGASDAFGVPEPVLDRLRCHLLLTQLPDQGVPEALECLADMVGFYENPPPPYRLLPQGPPVPVTIGRTIVRPVYPVTEED